MFISYSHRDLTFVSLLARGLKLAGVSLWRDVERMSGGQSISKEVEIAIDNATAFLSVISEHFDQSKWLRNELARAIDRELFVVPVVLPGGRIPISVSDGLQIRVKESGPNWSAEEMFRLIEEIRSAVGWSTPSDFDDFDPWSSDCGWSEINDLAARLTGTRWTWCENAFCDSDGKWIEFRPGGELRRSWRADKATWKVGENGMVVYGGHAFVFNLEEEEFRGVVASADRSNIERSGRLVDGNLDS